MENVRADTDFIPTVKISAERLAQMLGIKGRIHDVWTVDYQNGIEISYCPDDGSRPSWESWTPRDFANEVYWENS